MNLRSLLKKYLDKVKTFFKELNLFSTNEDEDPDESYNQILSTRIYLILLIGSVLVLLTYTAILPITDTIIIKHPTHDQYQQLISEKDSLQCPCKQMSLIYDNFIHLQEYYHPICSSDFVSDEWINYLSRLTLLSNIYYSDFRRTAVYSFQFLRSLCELTNTIVNEGIKQQLQLKSYVSSDVKSEEIFHDDIHSFLDLLIKTEEMNFVQLLVTSRSLILAQDLVSTLTTNVVFYLPTNNLIPNQDYYAHIRLRSYHHKKSDRYCECRFESCIEEYEIGPVDNGTDVFMIPDFYTGCFIVDSLLKSSLNCFYNETCVDQILFHLNSSLFNTKTNLKPLSSQFRNTNQTINELVSDLMIDKWNKTISFERYYQLCEPFQCIYAYTHQFVLVYIFTTLLGIIGGLVTILRLLVPRLVRIIRYKRRTNQIEVSIRLWVIGKLKSINLFPSNPPSTDYEIVRPQIISTYIYIIIFSIALVILTLYTAMSPQTITVTIDSPSLEQYEELKVLHSNTLLCECSQISTKFESFIKLIPEHHQICSSLFIKDSWRQYLLSNFASLPKNSSYTYSDDFRLGFGPNFFYQLESFCKNTGEIIQSRLNIFQSTDYLTKTVVDKQTFFEQQNYSIHLFKTVLHHTFAMSLSTFMEIIEWNALLTCSRTNYRITIMPSASIPVNIEPRVYPGSYVCYLSRTQCFRFTYIHYREYNGSTLVHETYWPVPFLYSGCYLLSGSMRSNLQCLYNASCLSTLGKYLQPTYQMNISILKQHSSTSVFTSESEVGDIIEHLMIEQWQENVSYELYYENCRPPKCTYTVVQRFLVSYIISAILGIIGGLSMVLQFIIPKLVKLIGKFFTKTKETNDKTNLRVRLRLSLCKIIQFIKTFNMFHLRATKPPSAPILEYQKQMNLKLQIISTRTYIFILFLSTILVSVYISLQKTSETRILVTSSYDDYQMLLKEYSSNLLSCPCTTISTKYSDFLSIKPNSLHPAVNNPMLIQNWIGVPLGFQDESIEDNLSIIYLFYIKLTHTFCIFSRSVTEYEIDQFLSTSYITSFLIEEKQFEAYINLQIHQFQKLLPSTLQHLIEIMSVMISANSLMSAAETNYQWNFIYSNSTSIDIQVRFPIIQLQTKTKPYQNQTCSCQTQSKLCKEPLYWPRTHIPIPGMYLGCYLMTGLLQSTLECFYDISCIRRLQSVMSARLNLTKYVLQSPPKSSLYQSNSTIQKLIDVLFIDEWLSNISYKSYYEKCQPRECHYTFMKRFQFLYVITTVISVLGGLNKVLPILIPLMIKTIHKFFRYFQRRNFRRRATNKNRINPIELSLST